ncbi:MAG: hypothetical protein IJ566_08880 [Cardiobacteriaceae bacterium]|nr:hypothetical protein [Cardiobacteriaceae bacterium]
MNAQTETMVAMFDMLPEQERNFAFEMLKRIVLAWDSDYTKLSPSEAANLAQAETDEYIDEADIDWNNLAKYE